MLKIVARKLTDVVKAKDKILQISPEKHSSIDKAGFYANKPASIDAGDNPVAYKIINSESISLYDQELKFNQIDITTMKNLELNNEFIQSDLGDISLYGKHEILLEDVDPKRITNKTIIL